MALSLNQKVYLCFMEINESIVDKLADLSNLHFDETEKKNLISDLRNMLEFVDKLNEVDTEGVEPLLHISNNVNELREDKVHNQLSAEQALSNSPLKDKSFFKVPKVINKGE